jgi:hypothetical protein
VATNTARKRVGNCAPLGARGRDGASLVTGKHGRHRDSLRFSRSANSPNRLPTDAHHTPRKTRFTRLSAKCFFLNLAETCSAVRLATVAQLRIAPRS